jgi:hypothetical protein
MHQIPFFKAIFQVRIILNDVVSHPNRICSFKNLIFLMLIYWGSYQTFWGNLAVRLFHSLMMRTCGSSLCSGMVQNHESFYMVSTSSSRVLGMGIGANLIRDETDVLF